MIESISLKIASAIKKANPNGIYVSIDVMQFALISLIGHILTFAISFTIATLLGTFIETVLVLFSFMLLRWFSGGYHFKSPEMCSLYSIVMVVLIPHIDISDTLNTTLMIINLIGIVIFAPVGENHSIFFQKQHKMLIKLIAVLIVSSNFLFSKEYITMSYFLQILSFIPTLLKGGEQK